VSERTDRERLEAALRELPGTANRIAAMLYAEGIKGEQGCLTRCPLAVWLTGRVGTVVKVGDVQAWTDLAVDGYVALPPGAIRFISRFEGDDGDGVLTCDWPDLVAP
jgi:hypothetical protein